MSGQTTSAPVIEVSGLSFAYNRGRPDARQAIRDVSFTVNRGDFVVFLGATGSGKSTLLEHLNGLHEVQAGQVSVLGIDLGSSRRITELRRRVGLVLQNPGHQVFERYVGDDIAFGPHAAGLSGAELVDRVRWAMELVDLPFEEFVDRLTGTLSGGERRRVGLAGVLALRPEILLLDEPAAGLDPVSHRDLLRLLRELSSQGLTVMMATHNMEDAAELADTIIVLDRGCIALQGPPREVFGQVKEMASLGLGQPAVVEVMAELTRRGLPVRSHMRTDVLTMDDAEAAILSLLEKQP